MYDLLSLLFILWFVAVYFILFAALVFWILKPWLTSLVRNHIEPILRHALEFARLFQGRSHGASAKKRSSTRRPVYFERLRPGRTGDLRHHCGLPACEIALPDPERDGIKPNVGRQ